MKIEYRLVESITKLENDKLWIQEKYRNDLWTMLPFLKVTQMKCFKWKLWFEILTQCPYQYLRESMETENEYF